MTYPSYHKEPSYAKSRLSGTVIKHNNQPLYVQNVGGAEVYVQNTITGEEFSVGLEEISVEPTPLGVVNTKIGAYYCVRVPSRYYKQGINNENIFTRKILSGRMSQVSFTSRPFGKTVIGDYPKIDETLDELLNEEAQARGISKDFTVSVLNSENLDLHYKTKLVGHVKIDTNPIFHLAPQKEYLREVLEEQLK